MLPCTDGVCLQLIPFYIISAECHICSHEIPGGAGHPPGLDGEISLAGGVNYPRAGAEELQGLCRDERDNKSLYQCSSPAVPAAFRQAWRALPARDISRVFIKMEITSLMKSASPSLLPKDAPRENPQGFLLLADISCDHVIKLLSKLQIFCLGNVGNEC